MPSQPAMAETRKLLDIRLELAPIALAHCRADGHLLAANRAFIDLAWSDTPSVVRRLQAVVPARHWTTISGPAGPRTAMWWPAVEAQPPDEVMILCMPDWGHSADAPIAGMTESDRVTGLPGRAAFEELAGRWFELRESQPFVLLFVDLDDFKKVNDEQGHLAGDKVLRQVATTLRAQVRDEDLVARFGGDEFVILLADARQGDVVADRLRRAIALEVGLRASVGIAATSAGPASLEALIAAADQAMYADKRRAIG